MQQELRAHLLALAETYAAARKLQLPTVGRLAADDWQFFARVKEGKKTFTIKKYDEIIDWFSANWPDRVRWPKSIKRPQVISAAAEERAAS